jgi:hypothetical protein
LSRFGLLASSCVGALMIFFFVQPTLLDLLILPSCRRTSKSHLGGLIAADQVCYSGVTTDLKLSFCLAKPSVGCLVNTTDATSISSPVVSANE